MLLLVFVAGVQAVGWIVLLTAPRHVYHRRAFGFLLILTSVFFAVIYVFTASL